MIKMAIYGKGGIGKSTTASNLSLAFAKKGLKVMQIGCDPKADSTSYLHGNHSVDTVLDLIRKKGKSVPLEELVTEGAGGVLCVEAGGPTPGMGCAGRGIIAALETLEEKDAFEIYEPDIVLYDVLGDVVCGGFAMPIREGYAEKVFLLTSGKDVFQLFGINRTPVFDIATIDVLCAAFFIIFFTGGRFRWSRIILSTVITVAYCLCVGQMHLISSSKVLFGLRLTMIALSIYGLCNGIEGKISFSWKALKKLVQEELGWTLLLMLLSVPALLCFGNTLRFAVRGLISAVLSFGGGDAYLAVANGMFVNTGMISHDEFYFQIASVANGLPGSILCKILAGVGYILGCQDGGVWCGIFVALCGFACSIAASGGTFSAVVYIYEQFENLRIFQVLQTYMRPIVAGLLLSVSTSMLYQNVNLAGWYGWPKAGMALLTIGVILLNVFWRRRGVVRPLQSVLFSAAASLAMCNVFASIP